MEAVTTGVVVAAVTGSSGIAAFLVAQANSIGSGSAITIGLCISACTAVAFAAVTLNNIKRDISLIMWRLHQLPCAKRDQCPDDDHESR